MQMDATRTASTHVILAAGKNDPGSLHANLLFTLARLLPLTSSSIQTKMLSSLMTAR
jgi:hypothetical protein